MKEVKVERRIQAPVEEVWRAATDIEGSPRRIDAIERVEMLTQGPFGVGTRWRETRRFFNREATEELEVIEVDEPSRYVVGCDSHGTRYRTEFRFLPEESGTRVEMRFRATPQTITAKILGVLTASMAKKIAEHCAADLDDIAASLEDASGDSG